MKFLHLSDLHIGKRIHGFSMLEEQSHILRQITALAIEEQVDGVLLAGDLYDKPIPSGEAVRLLDAFLTELVRSHIPVFAITGNHDSPDRLAFGTKIMAGDGLHLAACYDGAHPPVTLTDNYGPVDIYLLPFLRPAALRHVYPDAQQIATYEQAVAYAIEQWDLDPTHRNVLVAHQFVTGASVCDSEEIPIGGLDQISADVFNAFDYVALGHLHSPQRIAREGLRYCGTPLKYSFSESRQKKTACLVTLGEKGDLSVKEITLTPIHDMREIKGTYDTLASRMFYQNTNTEDYLHVILTDEEEIPEAMGRLRAIYPNLMRLSYDNLRSQIKQAILPQERPEKQSPMALFQTFYQLQNNQPMYPQQEAFLADLIASIWEEET